MDTTFERVRRLITAGDVRISVHGYEELAADGMLVRDVVHGVQLGEIVEAYPDYPKGPCVLVLQRDAEGLPVHALWGIPKGAEAPAVLITAYRPDPDRWSDDFKQRAP